jgi:hypothetical protein
MKSLSSLLLTSILLAGCSHGNTDSASSQAPSAPSPAVSAAVAAPPVVLTNDKWAIAGITLETPLSAAPALLQATHPEKCYSGSYVVPCVTIDNAPIELHIDSTDSRYTASLPSRSYGINASDCLEPTYCTDKFMIRAGEPNSDKIIAIWRTATYGAVQGSVRPAYHAVLEKLKTQYGVYREFTAEVPIHGAVQTLVWGSARGLRSAAGVSRCEAFIDTMVNWNSLTENPTYNALDCGRVLMVNVTNTDTEDGVKVIGSMDFILADTVALQRSYRNTVRQIHDLMAAAKKQHESVTPKL